MKRIMVNKEADLKLAKHEIAVMVGGGEGREVNRLCVLLCVGVAVHAYNILQYTVFSLSLVPSSSLPSPSRLWTSFVRNKDSFVVWELPRLWGGAKEDELPAMWGWEWCANGIKRFISLAYHSSEIVDLYSGRRSPPSQIYGWGGGGGGMKVYCFRDGM